MSFGRNVTTPWGQNWLNIAEPVLRKADSGRLERGLAYATPGRVPEPEFEPGRALATVDGSGTSRYRVEIILPGPDRIEAGCDCPDPVRPCKHVVAVVFRIGRIIDEDPSVLRTLRAAGGNSVPLPAEPLASPEDRTAGRSRWGTELATDAIDPADAFARPLQTLPDAVSAPDAVGEPCYCPPRPGTGVDLEALESIAAVAAGTAMTALVEADLPDGVGAT
ncbi:hypothetical protein [Glycomyces buryatensis]|uniref:SWIM-type domain-containing protein n=1 Tax=Glycomyces buryatensis TaxID=2570927 RepID=A0A4S8QCW1_9ACTN|nr:hypothetical protein [Glycomyces buryatensis]THV42140.1 hypothetical protein FAB82_07830 [Glycomyces buryatensis]